MEWKKLPPSRSITPARSGPLVPASAESYELPRVCSKFDRPYVVRYTRGPGGLLRFTGSKKIEAGPGAGQGSAPAPSARSITIPDSEIGSDSVPERCPWCGASGSLIFCEGCSSWVCRGLVTQRGGKDYFRCRASCGNKGELIATDHEFEGERSESTQRRMGVPAPASRMGLPKADNKAGLSESSKPALPGNDRPRLKG